MSEAALAAVLDTVPAPWAIAVSGGVDSLTLASFAHHHRPGAARMFHATSPAVPSDATARTRALALERGWDLHVLDAGEFADPAYLANPTDRCFFCKTDLYGAIAAASPAGATLLSGTNTDDLAEYRPGLDAARRHDVRHPFVEAGIGKQALRALAARLALGDVASLPSSPCLSSRIETGIPIDPATLRIVHDVEVAVRRLLAPQTVRCRIRADGMVIELDADALERAGGERAALNAALRPLIGTLPRLAPYRNGGAFIRRLPPERVETPVP